MVSPKMGVLRSSPSTGNDYNDPRLISDCNDLVMILVLFSISTFSTSHGHDTQLLETHSELHLFLDTVYYSSFVSSHCTTSMTSVLIAEAKRNLFFDRLHNLLT